MTIDALACVGREVPVISTGVYVLAFEGAVVYVGRSRKNIWARIAQHAQSFDFDRAFFFAVDVSEQAAVEAALVRAFNPEFTFQCSPDDSRDAEILAALGIAPSPSARAAWDARVRVTLTDDMKQKHAASMRYWERVRQSRRSARLFSGLVRLLKAAS